MQSKLELPGDSVELVAALRRIVELEAGLREIAEVADSGLADAKSSCRSQAKAVAMAARQLLE